MVIEEWIDTILIKIYRILTHSVLNLPNTLYPVLRTLYPNLK